MNESKIIQGKLTRIYRDEMFNTKSDGSGKSCHLGSFEFKGQVFNCQIPTTVESELPLSVGDSVSVAAREYNGLMYFTVIGRPLAQKAVSVDFFNSLLGVEETTEVVQEAL